MTLDRFVTLVEDFLRVSGMADRQLGLDALNDPAFVTDIRAGREPRERTRLTVVRFIESRGYDIEKLGPVPTPVRASDPAGRIEPAT